MNKSNKETNLIKKLLADQLDKKERKKLYYSNLIRKTNDYGFEMVCPE